MTEGQAHEAVDGVEQTWSCEIGEARGMWVKMLLPHESVDASIATLKLYERKRNERPSMAEFREMLLEIEEMRLSSTRPEVQGVSTKLPEWTHVWFWMRFKLKDFTMLPQQDPSGTVSGAVKVMSRTEYEKKRNEWVDAGSPTLDIDLFLKMISSA